MGTRINKENTEDMKVMIQTVLKVIKLYIISKKRVNSVIKEIKDKLPQKEIDRIFGETINSKCEMSSLLYAYLAHRTDYILLSDYIIETYDIGCKNYSIYYNPLMLYYCGYNKYGKGIGNILPNEVRIVVDNSYTKLSIEDKLKFIKGLKIELI